MVDKINENAKSCPQHKALVAKQGVREICVILVMDEDGYDIPVASGDNQELATELYEEFRKDNIDNPHWDFTMTEARMVQHKSA